MAHNLLLALILKFVELHFKLKLEPQGFVPTERLFAKALAILLGLIISIVPFSLRTEWPMDSAPILASASLTLSKSQTKTFSGNGPWGKYSLQFSVLHHKIESKYS